MHHMQEVTMGLFLWSFLGCKAKHFICTLKLTATCISIFHLIMNSWQVTE